MRKLFTGIMMAVVTAGLASCSNKVDFNTAATVGYDKARDGEPKTMGGPGGGDAKTGTKKGKAMPPENP
jgi:hypothetical protein